MPRGFAYPVGERAARRDLRADDVPGRGPDAAPDSRNYNWTIDRTAEDRRSIEQAHEQMNRVAAALDEQHPKWSPGRRARVITLHDHLVGRVRRGC